MTISKIEQVREMESFDGIKSIKLSSECTDPDIGSVLPNEFQSYDLENIFVNANNPLFCDINGVLFNKQQTALLCYPRGRKEAKYVIHEGVLEIGTDAFDCAAPDYGENDGLTNVVLPDSLKIINENAFWMCSGLEEITIPSGVTIIGTQAFFGCSSLTDIHVDQNNQNYCDIDGVLFTKDRMELIK